MKIVTLIGSYRKNGNTGRVVKMIEAHLQNEASIAGVALEIETLHLGELDLRPCRGCRACFDHGEDQCPQRDDLLAVKDKIMAADGLILATPVYVDDVSGLVKTWIDRLAHLCHRPQFAGKCAYMIATVGSSPVSHTMRTMMLALSTWGFHIVGQAGFKTGARMDDQTLHDRYNAQTRRAARQLLRAIHERQYLRPTFMSLMMFRIYQWSWGRADPQTLDYRYWHENGWLESTRTFYFPHQAGVLKTVLARGVGLILARVFAG